MKITIAICIAVNLVIYAVLSHLSLCPSIP